MPRWFGHLTALVLAVSLALTLVPEERRRPPSAQEPPPAIEALEDRMLELEEENAELRQRLEAVDDLQRRIDRMEQEARRPPEPKLEGLAAIQLPEEVRFCGERLPLERPHVRRRLLEEVERFRINEHWLARWHRRSARVFPPVRDRLRAAGLPEDLRYVLVIESGVDARAVSSAGAVGWWQFIGGTAKRYGLQRNQAVDERRDLGRATDAAILYFRDLYEEFGSWPLVLAAYNAGEKRVALSLQSQGADDYYDLVLPRETEAYWFKATAAKLLLEDPERYGVRLPPVFDHPVVCDTLEVEIHAAKLEIRELLEGTGLGYRAFKELNPAWRKTWLPRGRWRIAVPRTQRADLVQQLRHRGQLPGGR